MEKLASFLNQEPHRRLLDVGTGAGNFISLIKQLYQEYDEIVGIDSLDYAVNSAKKNFMEDDKVRFEVMDAIDMTFEDDSFDVVCLSNSLHHLKDIDGIFREMQRVLKPGGYLLISEMIANDLDDRQISHLKMHHFAAEIDRYLGDVHNETYQDNEILEILKANTNCELVDHWPLTYERRKENTDEEINWLFSTLDRVVNRVQDENKRNEFAQQAKDVKEYISEHGFDSATTLIVVMKK